MCTGSLSGISTRVNATPVDKFLYTPLNGPDIIPGSRTDSHQRDFYLQQLELQEYHPGPGICYLGSRYINPSINLLVRCFVYHVSCKVFHLQCFVYSVSCGVFRIQFFVYGVSCTVYRLRCFVISVCVS